MKVAGSQPALVLKKYFQLSNTLIINIPCHIRQVGYPSNFLQFIHLRNVTQSSAAHISGHLSHGSSSGSKDHLNSRCAFFLLLLHRALNICMFRCSTTTASCILLYLFIVMYLLHTWHYSCDDRRCDLCMHAAPFVSLQIWCSVDAFCNGS